jgi:hypothetical protein
VRRKTDGIFLLGIDSGMFTVRQTALHQKAYNGRGFEWDPISGEWDGINLV